MITIYHLAVSQSDRIVWLMEELGLPYQLEWFDRGEDLLAPPEYLSLHPVATSPVIKDGDLVLAESPAIVEYISQRYGNGQLSVTCEQANYADYLYWMQFNSNLQTLFFLKMGLEADGNMIEDDGVDSLAVKVYQRRSEAYYQYLNQRLGQVDYLAGPDFTCADILIMFGLTTATTFGARRIDDLPNVVAYVERISQRPAYIKAMLVAGPDAKKPG